MNIGSAKIDAVMFDFYNTLVYHRQGRGCGALFECSNSESRTPMAATLRLPNPPNKPCSGRLAHAVVVVGLCLFLSLASACAPMRTQSRTTGQDDAVMTNRASGTFEGTLNPQAPDDSVGDPTVSRMSIDKQFHGDLEATSKGQMLAVRTDVQGSAGYVAMERVTGTLHGRSGAFTLQHSGTMTRDAQQLTVTVVPDSGTGELVGLTGKMTIDIVDGKHFYVFDYTLAALR